MEDPVGCRFVLPLTRFAEVAHDRNRAGPAQTPARLRRRHETEHTMTTTDQNLDQRGAKESIGSRDERRGECVTGHADSVEGRQAGHHPQRSHSTRTALVRSPAFGRSGQSARRDGGTVAPGASGAFGARLKALRLAAGFTQEELATIAGLSVHAVSALERGERRRPHVETVRALSAALDLAATARDALLASARAPTRATARDEPDRFSAPLPLTALLGRDADVKALRHWLAEPARLVTLTGPGGAGKTRLALEVARAIEGEGASRVRFVALAAVRDAALVAPAIAEALGVLDATTRNLPARATLASDGRPTLLVLDNFEQVLDAAPLIADLVKSVTTLRVLVTSRAPLRVRGEREYPVGPLSVDVDGDATSPADLAHVPAVRLFVERARDVQPEFRLTAANGATVTAICRRLDALPLALELAAPWLKVLTPQQLWRRLEQDVLLSTVGRPRDLPERQQTINATVAWSYRLLPPDEQRAFRRLGALPGRFPIEAATAVLAGREGPPVAIEHALRAAAGLIDKSLLVRTESAVAARPLYQMLETVRGFAALELGAAGEREDALAGLARYRAAEASLAAGGLA
jgi:predicted ATPase/DNA-binding XRE family transcriptional regulator